MSHPRFHLAVPVDDLDAARRFYGEILACPQGRSSDTWVDWNLYGHQLVTHLDAPATDDRAAGDATATAASAADATTSDDGRTAVRNAVDGHDVPVPHFGVLLDVDAFHQLAERLRAGAVGFVIEPYLRFAGEPGEQWTMFVRDPAGNNLEFKAFADDAMVFAV